MKLDTKEFERKMKNAMDFASVKNTIEDWKWVMENGTTNFSYLLPSGVLNFRRQWAGFYFFSMLYKKYTNEEAGKEGKWKVIAYKFQPVC